MLRINRDTSQYVGGKCLFITAIILLQCTAIFAQEQTRKQEDIDVDYEKCVIKDSSCANISDCAFIAYGKWEKQMTGTYEKLMRELKKEDEKKALKAAQDAWVAYKEATFVSYDFMFNQAGDKWCRLRHESRIEMIRRRTIELRDYYEDFKKR